jgi:hypothetical protein
MRKDVLPVTGTEVVVRPLRTAVEVPTVSPVFDSAMRQVTS